MTTEERKLQRVKIALMIIFGIWFLLWSVTILYTVSEINQHIQVIEWAMAGKKLQTIQNQPLYQIR